MIKNVLYEKREQGYKAIINGVNGRIIECATEEFNKMEFFCDNDGVKFGTEQVNNMIIPKHIFIEAIKMYTQNIER